MRPAALLAATLAAALSAPLAAPAATLGKMAAQIGGRRIAYAITDAADAGSGWEARPGGQSVSILWKGPKPTDLMLMEMVVQGGKAASGRVLLPEARQGALEAKLPRSLKITIDRTRTDGSWLRLEGHLSGTFYPVRRSGRLLPEDGVRISARFTTWVPGISTAPAPAAKPAAGKHDTGKPAKPRPTAPAVSKLPRPRMPAKAPEGGG